MRKILVAGTALFAALSPCMSAVAQSATATESLAPSQVGELARLMSPRALLIETELREFDKNFVPTLRANEHMKPLEGEYPGIFETMHAATRPLVAKAMEKAVDKLHSKTAALFAESMTSAEIADLIAFYRSPAGQNVLTQMAAAIDASKLYEQALDDPEREITSADISDQTKSTAARAMKNYSTADQAELVKFMGRPAFWKLAKLQPRIREIMAETFNAPDPEIDAEMEAVMMATAERYMTGKPTPANEGGK